MRDLDVAEAGVGAGGADAEHHQRALRREPEGLARAGHEGLDVRHQVVGREHQHHGVAAELLDALERRQGDGRPGVAALGFEQQGGVGRIGHLPQHVLGEEQVVLVGHDHQVAGAAGLPALDGLLQQGGAAQLHEGLGKGLPGSGPEPGAGASREHH